LLSAIPRPDPTKQKHRIILDGDVPSPINPPAGCRFNSRCRYARPRCSTEEPVLREAGAGHRVACHFFEAIEADHSGAELHAKLPDKFTLRLAAFEAAKLRQGARPGAA
jgi:oligopeptide/dipeptide ABC transporter ATP-binding protein